MWVWNRQCDPADDKASWPQLFRAAMTWRLYDTALLVAVAYPLLLLVGQWAVTGDEGQLGNTIVLPAAEFWPDRAAFLIAMLIMIAGKIGQNWLSASSNPFLRQSSAWLLVIAFAIAVAFVVTITVTVTGSGVFAIVVSVAGAGASLVVVASVGVFAILFLDRRGSQPLARLLLTCAMILAWLIATQMLDWTIVSERGRNMFLFFAVLPLLDGVFDVMSYALTLSLIRRGLHARLPFLCGLADLIFACLLFLGSGATLVVVVKVLNLLTGVSFIDLPVLFAGVHDTPATYIWLYLMLFSTILPTALHGLVSMMGFQGICPHPRRRKLANLVDAAAESQLHTVSASFWLGLVWTLPVMCALALGWVIWHFGKDVIVAALEYYFNFLLWVA